MKKEVQTKKRIVDGTVDFQEDPWNVMPDGALESTPRPL
jgi:hypothetical protein